MAGLTYTVNSRKRLVDGQMLVVDAAFDSSYPTGGELVIASELGLSAVQAVVVLNTPNVVWDRTSGKLVIYAVSGDATGFELADLTVTVGAATLDDTGGTVAASVLASTAVTVGAAAVADGSVVTDELVDLTVNVGATTVTDGALTMGAVTLDDDAVTIGATTVADGAVTGTLELATTEVANASDQSAVVATLLVIGL